MRQKKEPVIALMGLAFKANIDDLRESPAVYITQKILQTSKKEKILIVEPNLKTHALYNLTDCKKASQKADIIVFLVKHNEFKDLKFKKDAVYLDFCGVLKKKYE